MKMPYMNKYPVIYNGREFEVKFKPGIIDKVIVRERILNRKIFKFSSGESYYVDLLIRDKYISSTDFISIAKIAVEKYITNSQLEIYFNEQLKLGIKEFDNWDGNMNE